MEYNRIYTFYRGASTYKHHITIYYHHIEPCVDYYTWDGTSLEFNGGWWGMFATPLERRQCFPTELEFLKDKVKDATTKKTGRKVPGSWIESLIDNIFPKDVITYDGFYREIKVGELLISSLNSDLVGHSELTIHQASNALPTVGNCSTGVTFFQFIDEPAGLVDYCYPCPPNSNIKKERLFQYLNESLPMVNQHWDESHPDVRPYPDSPPFIRDTNKEVFDIIVKTADKVLPLLTFNQFNQKYNLNPQVQPVFKNH